MSEKNKLKIEKASNSDRFYALLIDYFIILVLPSYILSIFNLEYNYDVMKIVSLLYFLILFKDIFGRSIGKKIMRLKIVNKYDYTKNVNPFITIIRNIFLMFGIIEPLVILFANGKRIADMVTDSIVIKINTDTFPKRLPQEKFNDDLSESSVCVKCGNEIKPNNSICDKCGWTYKNTPQ